MSRFSAAADPHNPRNHLHGKAYAPSSAETGFKEAIMSTQSTADTIDAYTCDLSARLFKPGTLFEKEIARGKWVLFAPDFPGLPVVVNDDIHEIMNKFEKGAHAATAFASGEDFDRTCSSLLFLEERGFLRSAPATFPYPLPPDIRGEPGSFGVWLHIVNQCNLVCEYCFVEHKNSDVMKDDVMEQVTDAISHTALSKRIKKFDLKFAGGEPTLVLPALEAFHDKLTRKLEGTDTIFQTAVLSNGTVMNDRLLNFLKRPRTGIGISLDGFGKTHDIYRRFKHSGKGSWQSIERNIRILREHGITPYIMATISQASCKGLSELLLWIYENSFRCRLSVVRQPSGCRDCSDQTLSKGYEELCEDVISAFENALTDLEQPNVFVNLTSAMEICELHFNQPAQGISCSIGHSHVVIKPDGHIVPCPMMIDEEGCIPCKDLLMSCAETFSYKLTERAASLDAQECLSCRWFPVCAGGCAITNLRLNGHPFTKAKLCAFYRYIIPRYVVFFGKKALQTAELKSAGCPSNLNGVHI